MKDKTKQRELLAKKEKNMTNKELQARLAEFPDDLEILVNRDYINAEMIDVFSDEDGNLILRGL